MDETLPLPLLERVNQVCLEFERAWKQGPPPQINQYLDATRGNERAKLLRELLLLEVDYRRRRGESPHADEYHSQFPQDTAAIDAAFA